MINIIQTPLQYEPAFQNTIPFVVQSDLATASNFRYIFETYTGDTWATVNNFQSFNSAYPRFDDDCIYSPHLILQSVVDYSLDPFIDDFTPATSSFQFYRVDFGEQYNPNVFFSNTFPYLPTTPDELLLIIDGTASSTVFQVGDQIRIDKTDKSINPQYDGFTTIEGVFTTTFGTQSYTFLWVDTLYGVAPTFGTFSFPETGFITDLVRLAATTSGTFSTFDGVRQYDEIDFDFEETYGIDIDWTLVNQNAYFDTTDDWIISNFLGTASISGGVLNYFDSTNSGNSIVRQNDILVVGEQYRITLETSNNNFVIGQVGDEVDASNIIFTQGDNGVYTFTFTAQGNDFILDLSSAGGVTQGVDIDYIIVEGLYVTQNRFLSVYPENTPKPTYLTNYETLSFFVDPLYPDFSYFGLPRISHRTQLFDPSGNLVDETNNYMDEYQEFSFGTPRFDIPVGPAIDTQGQFFTSSINCDGWSYKTWLEGVNLVQHLLNPTFSSSTASWLITTDPSGNATASFGGGLFDMNQEIEVATGSILLEQSNVFTPGLTYALVMGIVNNDDVEVYIGDSDNMVITANSDETGNEVIFPFVPTSPTFSAEFIATDFSSYGIEVDYIYAVTIGTASRISEIKEYDIICQCREYDLVQLAFVNKLGGVDYWTFNLVSKFTSDIIRERIKKTLPYNYNVGNRQHKVINQTITENWMVNTDWITDDEALFIRELIESPEVYWIKNGKLYPIIIMDNSYQFKSSLNDYQVQYTINFAMAFDRLSNA